METKKPIQSFRDLNVYKNLYQAMLVVLKEVVPKLPKEEKYDLADQIRRCCKAAPALLAEGFAKRYQKINWLRYLNDTIGESNEMIHHLSVCLDVYPTYINKHICEELIESYNICCKQLTNLKKAWIYFHERNN